MYRFLLVASAIFFHGLNGFSQQGVVEVRGKVEYANYTVPKYFSNGTIVMIDASAICSGQMKDKFVGREGQQIGMLTKPLIPSPSAYVVHLPVLPNGVFVDLDQNGKADKGVQIFITSLGLNFRGDSYLDQLEQAGLKSIIEDAKTGNIRRGALLVFAPDDKQGFPSGWGKDRKLFTRDDPVTRLKAGYTVVSIDSAGTFHFRREAIGQMDIIEEKERATPDFSGLSFSQSFNSLIDLLKVRYAYTQLRHIDWEEMRRKYLPVMTSAAQRKDSGDYYMALRSLARDIKDVHVQVSSYLPALSGKEMKWRISRFMGRVGADLTKLTDGRYVVTSVYDSTPARDAGWRMGTEILAVNGTPIAQHIDTIPLTVGKATVESSDLAKATWALSFPVGSRVDVSFRQPGSNLIENKVMYAIETDGAEVTKTGCDCPPRYDQHISYQFLADGEIGYIQWRDFGELPITINVYEHFLSMMPGRKGMVIDMRGNSGGLLQLMYTMASYFFPKEQPANMNWLDYYHYDEGKGDFVKQEGKDTYVYSPVTELTYTGKVVVLVDHLSASAGEYFPQFLQRMKRAVVIGESASEGAGGVLSMAGMPGPVSFTYTGGRTFFAGTKEVNLEGKGVEPDIRVPVTLEHELAKKNCKDPVLEAAVKYLQQ